MRPWESVPATPAEGGKGSRAHRALAIGDPALNSGLDRIDRSSSASSRSSPKVAASDRSGEVARIVPLSSAARIGIAQHHSLQSEVALIFSTKPVPSSFRLPCMGRTDFRSSLRTIRWPPFPGSTCSRASTASAESEPPSWHPYMQHQCCVLNSTDGYPPATALSSIGATDLRR